MMDACIYDCGNKLGNLSANLAVGMQDPKSKERIIAVYDSIINDYSLHQIKANISDNINFKNLSLQIS